MEEYEIIKKELKDLNFIETDSISEKIIKRLIEEKFKKRNTKKHIITIFLFTIGVIFFSIIIKKIYKKSNY